MKKFTVRIHGGLGNQLHCYAFGRAIAAHNSGMLEIDGDSGYWNDPYGRQFLLKSFPLLRFKSKVMPNSKLGRLIFKTKIKFGLLFSAKLPLSLRAVIEEVAPYSYREDIHHTNYKVNPYFIGYWATYRYYEQVAEELRNELVPPNPDNLEALKILNQISSSRSCSIHYRIYKEEKAERRPSLSEYYSKAIGILKGKYPDIKFFVFSDDISTTFEKLSGLSANATYVDIKAAKGNVQSLIDFYLMYSCEHAIIGDSTFSWWAAWLSDLENKTIIAPRGLSPWGDDLTPSHWITIDK